MIEPNKLTYKYLDSYNKGYVDKSIGIEKFQNHIKELYKLDNILRFDLGENTDGPSNEVLEEFENIKNSNILSDIISEYPDSNYFKLRKELSSFYDVDIDNISIGTGSSEIIRNINKCWLEIGEDVIFPIPSFYKIENSILEFGGVPRYIKLKRDENFQWTNNITNELMIVSSRVSPKLIWLVTPNNPIGAITPTEDIIKIIENNQNSIIVVDEAYGEYVNEESMANFVGKYDNLLVLRTFSKAYGMAGLRLGYCIGSKELIKILEKIRLEFPVTLIGAQLGIRALKDQNHIEVTKKKLMKRKEILLNNLDKLGNIEYIPSKTNIMLIKLKDNADLYIKLLKKGIIAARMNNGGMLDGYVRITIKNDIDNNFLIKSLLYINK